MKAFKGTPGPWRIENDKGHNWEVNRLIGAKGENLGDLYLAHRVGEESEYLANAALISAAPDLLEALQACLCFANIRGIVNGVDVHAAVAKALGHSQK